MKPQPPRPRRRPLGNSPSRSPFWSPFRHLPLLAALLALGACAAQPRSPAAGPYAPGATAPNAPEPPRARVALLLPLSGSQAPLGQAMLNAATLALFEQASPGVDFVPHDTRGSAAGAAEAARAAVSEGARVMVGPLTSGETGGAAAVSRAASIPMLAFTNDANVAGNGVWTLGVTPAQQVRRLVGAATTAGVRRIGLAAPSGAYAQQLTAALRTASQEAGLLPPLISTYPAGALPAMAAKDLAARLKPAEPATATDPAAPPPPVAVPEADAIGLLILAEGGSRARQFASALAEAGVVVPPLRLAGTALWAQDGATLGQEPALAGAVFPGPDNTAHEQFNSRYRQAFGDTPPRLAAVAYDAATVAARATQGGPNAPATLPIGEIVLGADGGLRLSPDGQTQRALALYALQPGGEPRVVEPATLPEAGF
ncbi:penicillin-binding protein activator [Roseomonas gilardii]|uniref:Penicillin-binding protein activator n=1 Tax=Roseomonas gilardii TaxID=257708 RepID=A0ABU3MGZ3_9PROT|nr:penicillin-binding protein activator [Roseomonas gilardii]MDT8331721.1 penicillin-binding protein activator [Roseomonas gilardii]